MTCWEYRSEDISTEQIANQLNFIGKEGWELVCIIAHPTQKELMQAVFKRPQKGQNIKSFGSS